MSKERNNWRAVRGSVNYNDTAVSLSYDIMEELRRGLSIHGYSFQNGQGDWSAIVRLVYTTLDGKKHELTSTEISL